MVFSQVLIYFSITRNFENKKLPFPDSIPYMFVFTFSFSYTSVTLVLLCSLSERSVHLPRLSLMLRKEQRESQAPSSLPQAQ